MNKTHLTAIVMAISIALTYAPAVLAKLPWPYGDRRMNELAVQWYTQQQLAKGNIPYPYNYPYGYRTRSSFHCGRYGNNYGGPGFNYGCGPYPWGYNGW